MMSKEAIEERSRKTKAQFKSSRHFCYWTEDTYFKEEDAAGKHQRRGTLEELTTKAAYELYKEVPTVTADDLAALVTKKKAAVVVFFATWCPFCTKVVEEGQDDDTPAPYSEFWGEVHDDDLLKDKLEVVKYDASNTEDLEKVPKEFGQIKFFPNVKGLTADGKLKEFDNDPRSSDELFEFGKAVAGEAQGPSMKYAVQKYRTRINALQISSA
ncbi:unnamed protein product [Amoebophrya sp. A120]|nr:unnamed protein product [Amoebophrya sp. A120]|eukprot:GSA120T00010885001.1